MASICRIFQISDYLMHHGNLDSQMIFSHACQIATSMICLAEAVNCMICNDFQVLSDNSHETQYLNY